MNGHILSSTRCQVQVSDLAGRARAIARELGAFDPVRRKDLSGERLFGDFCAAATRVFSDRLDEARASGDRDETRLRQKILSRWNAALSEGRRLRTTLEADLTSCKEMVVMTTRIIDQIVTDLRVLNSALKRGATPRTDLRSAKHALEGFLERLVTLRHFAEMYRDEMLAEMKEATR